MPTLGSRATIIQFAPPHMHHNKTPLDIALDYVARGWNPVPVGFRSKRPSAGEGWQLIRITASNAAQYFNGGEQNIGLQMGPASNNLTDGDIDIEEARAIAPYFMPRTKSKFGRSSARWSHYLYHSNLAEITDDGSIPFKDPTTKPETMILELRIGGGNKGAQTVAPGSVHEDTGEPIVWEEDGPPTRIAGDELLRCTKITAALALLARHWPQRGSKARHFTALRLGGFFARCGWNETQIELALEALTRAAKDEEPWDRKAAGRDAQRHFASGGNTAGFPALREDFGEPIAKRVAEWLGYQSEHRDEQQAETKSGDTQYAPCAIEETLAVFKQWLILPNLTPVYAVLGTVAANLLPGDPVWLGIIGPPSSAKTEILNSISLLPNVVQAATLTPAGLLSGTSKKQYDKGAKGGLLRQIGSFGIIALKDFGSVLSMRPDAKAEILAALREIYDGAWTRHLGTDGGRTLSWSGKIVLLFAATGVIDAHYGVIGAMGDRFLLSRLAPVEHGQFSRALQHMGAATTRMRKELAEAVARLFAGRRPDPRPISQDEINHIDRVIMLVVRLRGAIERDRYSRDVEAIYGAEGTARIGLTLERLLAGLDTLGVERATALKVVEAVAMDSVPPIRRRAYEFLQAATNGPAETSTIANAIDLSTVTTRRALEDLAAYRLVERESQGQGKSDLWKVKPNPFSAGGADDE